MGCDCKLGQKLDLWWWLMLDCREKKAKKVITGDGMGLNLKLEVIGSWKGGMR
jgi:hypothetical protein